MIVVHWRRDGKYREERGVSECAACVRVCVPQRTPLSSQRQKNQQKRKTTGPLPPPAHPFQLHARTRGVERGHRVIPTGRAGEDRVDQRACRRRVEAAQDVLHLRGRREKEGDRSTATFW